MSDQTVGLNVDQMGRLAERLKAAGVTLHQAEQTISRAGRSTWWQGQTAVRFRAAWSGGMSGRLRVASEQLDHQSNKIRSQLQEQLNASSSGIDVVGASRSFAEGFGRLNLSFATAGAGKRFIPGLVDAYGWLSNGKDLLEAVPIVKKGAALGMRLGMPAGKAINAGLNMSKLAAKGLSAWSGMSIAIGVVDVGHNAYETGWTSGETYSAEVNVIGATAATVVAGPLGGVTWDLTSRLTEWSVNALDRRFDTSGAFVGSVVARTGEVPDYSGATGLPRYIRDGFLNAFSPRAWGL